jgi:hypothetical protein
MSRLRRGIAALATLALVSLGAVATTAIPAQASLASSVAQGSGETSATQAAAFLGKETVSWVTPAGSDKPVRVITFNGAPASGGMTQALSDCGAVPRFCIYWNGAYVTPVYQFTGVSYTCINIGPPWNNQTSSVYNKYGFTIRMYFFSGCWFDPIGFYDVPATTAVDFAGSYWNDKFDSFARL